MLRLAAFLTATLAAALPARAVEVTTFTLDNGMDIVVLEDHRAPVVVDMVWYRAGAADEEPGVSGVAHYLEHLMFKGTDDLAPGEFSATVAANGGTDNAATSQDYTMFYQRVAADRLELMMQMEADRMRDLQLDDRAILTERQVVLEERGQRTDSNPSALFGEERGAAQYMNHPYRVPIIGWRHEIEALKLDDVMAFYRKNYAPNNAILIVAGDAQPDEVLAMAEKHFGALEPTPGLKQRARPQEPPQRAERRIVMEDSRVAQPYVIRTYLAPERDMGDQREAAALTLLASVLGGAPQTSVLGRRLQVEDPVAVYTSAFYSGISYDDTNFGLFIMPSPGVSLGQAEAAMDREIAAFLDEGVDAAQLERIKMQLRADLIYETDNTQRLANRYGRALTAGLTVADVEEWPQILQSITGEEIVAAGRRVFNRDNAVTGWLRAPAPDATPANATEEMTQ